MVGLGPIINSPEIQIGTLAWWLESGTLKECEFTTSGTKCPFTLCTPSNKEIDNDNSSKRCSCKIILENRGALQIYFSGSELLVGDVLIHCEKAINGSKISKTCGKKQGLA
jgi:hypothetical protein